MNHTFSLALVLFHDGASQDRRDSQSQNVLADAVEGARRILCELGYTSNDDALSNRHDSSSGEEKEPHQSSEAFVFEGA